MGSQRVAVVTGGASGIGRATSKRLAKAGDHIIIADLNQQGGQAVVAEITAAGGSAEFRAVDVADDASVTALGESVRDDHDAADVLVNCAGILQNVSDLASMDMDEHDRVWRINYRGTYICCRAFTPAMAAAGGGAIVNISSSSAIAAFPLNAYGPGKAAIDRLTAILGSELGPKGIRVNAVVPGYVLTEQMQTRIDSGHRDPSKMNRQSALDRMVLPAEIADGIHFLCSDAARAITGTTLAIDAGWLANVTYRQHPGLDD
jgi:NAD(P)-dependent dehydrogenase (short-subunit alcohol dehydrogenase family)